MHVVLELAHPDLVVGETEAAEPLIAALTAHQGHEALGPSVRRLVEQDLPGETEPAAAGQTAQVLALGP